MATTSKTSQSLSVTHDNQTASDGTSILSLPVNDVSGSNNDASDKGQTFRKRRLSLTLQTSNHKSSDLYDTSDDINDSNSDDEAEADDDGVAEGEETFDIQCKKAPTVLSHQMLNGSSEHTSSTDLGDEKAQTFRKRRLSLTTTSAATSQIIITTSPTSPAAAAKGKQEMNHRSAGGGVAEFRRSSIDSHSSIASSSICSHDTTSTTNLVSRTLHSGELVSTNGTQPPSPAHGPSFSNHLLYHQPAIVRPDQRQPPVLELGSSATTKSTTFPQVKSINTNHGHSTKNETIPKWKRRHTFEDPDNTDHHKLPFTRDVVGTYSCHGVEPVYDYDDDYEDDEDDQVLEAKFAIANQQQHQLPTPITVAKINQDRGGVVCPYGNHPKTALFAVYDGHGHGGELVSQFALYEVQRRLEKHPTFDTDIERAIKETFLAVDDALSDEPLINPMFAGTTACVVLLQNRRLTIGNAGDSRAVCARRKQQTLNGMNAVNEEAPLSSFVFKYTAVDLSFDQNPDVPAEMERIQKAGGFVSLPPGPGLSARVWLDPNCTQIGLAMSRSIGDHAIGTVGVIAEPVVTYHNITDDDDFLIVASDGVWEFLDSNEAVNIVGNNIHRGATKACQALIEAAAARWYEEEGAYRDDITAIVVRLQELWNRKTVHRKKGKSVV